MSAIDWAVMFLTLGSIVFFGIWKSRKTDHLEAFLLADRELPWYHVGLSVMATQASAITFLSAPGQAYGDGMRFIQFYFGLPLAMIAICIFFIPTYRRLNVYTAYEYLENRFDSKTRVLTSLLFLLQRGLSTGITLFAPSIVLSTLLGVDIGITTLFTGGIVVAYTVFGGTKAVSYTQLLQMGVIFTGLAFAGWMVVDLLPEDVGFIDALKIAGKMEKLNALDTSFDWNNKYNIWSGIIGGFFLQLSYFGTDQSQVGRYLTGSSSKQSKLGLVMNGIIKIPMQFSILLIGVLVFVFYQFHTPPVYFDRNVRDRIEDKQAVKELDTIERQYASRCEIKQQSVLELTRAIKNGDQQSVSRAAEKVRSEEARCQTVRDSAVRLIQANDSRSDSNDTNYVFLHFVIEHLPKGLIGLLIAIILLAAMGSTASGLNSLASSFVIDIYRRHLVPGANEKHYLAASRWSTAAWGIICTITALYAGRLGNLIEVVNVLGSLFYGTILGIFMTAFLSKSVRGHAVFLAALLAEAIVLAGWYSGTTAFLWLNVIGCIAVMLFARIFQILTRQE